MFTLIFLSAAFLAGGGTFYWFFKRKNKKEVKQQSVILLEKIKQVCKLVTAEGHFSDILQHTHKEKYLLGLTFKLLSLQNFLINF